MVQYPTDEGVVKALDGVSLDIAPGRTLGVVGESGCGKSTVGRAVLQILDRPGRVVGGEILWDAREMGGETLDLAVQEPNGPEMRALRGGDIAMVFQEPMTSFSPIHTVGNQMSEAIRIHQDKTPAEAREWSIELLNMVGIPNAPQRFDEFSYQLSGGLRQRAMIAMAISCGPKLLIADEPTTALDVTTQAQILDLLRTLQEEQKMAIILITHNLGVIAEMADEVVVMYLGRAAESGPSTTYSTTPSTRIPGDSWSRSQASRQRAERSCLRSRGRSLTRSTGRLGAPSLRGVPPSCRAHATRTCRGTSN